MAIISEKIEGKIIEVLIESSNLKSAKYNTESQDLVMTFNSGAIYEYNNVPWEKFTKFRMSKSQGKYFNENISKSYKYTKIG
jgi:hypothetical protein